VVVVIVISEPGSAPRAAHRSSSPSVATPTGQPGTGTRAGAPAQPGSAPARPASLINRQLGQLIVGRFTGTQPSAGFLARVRTGQIGGVILFADNAARGVNIVRQSIRRLQDTAEEGGNPPLLMMADQEGGTVRRFPGPPSVAPSAMSSDSIALQQGEATGRLLRSVGVNVDLAPVADVKRAPGSFLGTRSFGDDPREVAARACAFAQGLASEGVAYTLKHFPGLGRATASTDVGPVSIDASAEAIRDDDQAYLMCGSSPLALVMVSSAIYPNLSGPLPAVMSPLIYQRELPMAIPGPAGPRISDDLQAPALAVQAAPARRAIDAGLDLALYASTEQGSAAAYRTLLADVRSGAISVPRIRQADQTIQTLKGGLGGG
jgi:beta-N-acetylhexosaminidase